MKKTFLTLLGIAALVWGYVVVQVAMTFLGKSQENGRPVRMESLPAIIRLARLPLDTVFRDPFQSYLYAQKPPPPRELDTTRRNVPATRLVLVEPIKAVVSGILWGEPPVAILMQDGKTELVNVGTEVWGLKVLRIDRHQVTVSKQGRKFTLDY